jgi:hypothetical protein
MQPLRLHINSDNIVNIVKSPWIMRFILSLCALSICAWVSSCSEDGCAPSDDPCCGDSECVRKTPKCTTVFSSEILYGPYISYYEGCSFTSQREFEDSAYEFISDISRDQIQTPSGYLEVNIDVKRDGERIQEVSMREVPLGIVEMTRTSFDVIAWNQPLTEHHLLIAPFVARSLRLYNDPVIEVWPHPMLPPLRSPLDELTQALLSEKPWLGTYIIHDAWGIYPQTSDADFAANWFFRSSTTREVRARMHRDAQRESIEMFTWGETETTLEGVAHYTLNAQGEPTGLELQDAQGEVLLWTSSTESTTPDADAPPTAARQVTWIAAPSPQAPPTQTLRLYLDDADRLVGVHLASDGPTLMNTTTAQANPFRARIDYSVPQHTVLIRDDGLDGSINSLEVLQTDAEGAPLYGLRFSEPFIGDSSTDWSNLNLAQLLGDWSETHLANLAQRALSALSQHPCIVMEGHCYPESMTAVTLPPSVNPL